MAHPDRHPSAVRNGLLAALPPEDLARLRPRLQPVELPFDQTLYAADGAVEAVLFPESGMVSLLATLEDGEQVEVGIAGSEGLGRNHAGRGGDGAGEAELGDLAGEVVGLPLGRALVEVGGPEVLVDGAVAQDVPDGGQDGGSDGADRLLRAAALAQALELRPEIAVLLARCRPGALHEGGLQPGRALAQPRGAALARALVTAGT